jgi:hypothetical protein
VARTSSKHQKDTHVKFLSSATRATLARAKKAKDIIADSNATLIEDLTGETNTTTDADQQKTESFKSVEESMETISARSQGRLLNYDDKNANTSTINTSSTDSNSYVQQHRRTSDTISK